MKAYLFTVEQTVRYHVAFASDDPDLATARARVEDALAQGLDPGNHAGALRADSWCEVVGGEEVRPLATVVRPAADPGPTADPKAGVHGVGGNGHGGPATFGSFNAADGWGGGGGRSGDMADVDSFVVRGGGSGTLYPGVGGRSLDGPPAPARDPERPTFFVVWDTPTGSLCELQFDHVTTRSGRKARLEHPVAEDDVRSFHQMCAAYRGFGAEGLKDRACLGGGGG